MNNEQETKENLIIQQLYEIGEDPRREGLKDTPYRITKMWNEIFAGYKMDPTDLLTTFTLENYDQIILLKNIEMYSMCEHHMLPFYGKAHVAYIPNKRVIGVSKLARLVDVFAKRLQIQERIGQQVTSLLMKHLEPKGAACIIEAVHTCMLMRGTQKQNSVMVTSSVEGVFKEETVKTELLKLIK